MKGRNLSEKRAERSKRQAGIHSDPDFSLHVTRSDDKRIEFGQSRETLNRGRLDDFIVCSVVFHFSHCILHGFDFFGEHVWRRRHRNR